MLYRSPAFIYQTCCTDRLNESLHNVGLSRSLIKAKLRDWSTKYGIFVDLINTNG